jgi:hypothetical protein
MAGRRNREMDGVMRLVRGGEVSQYYQGSKKGYTSVATKTPPNILRLLWEYRKVTEELKRGTGVAKNGDEGWKGRREERRGRKDIEK